VALHKGWRLSTGIVTQQYGSASQQRGALQGAAQQNSSRRQGGGGEKASHWKINKFSFFLKSFEKGCLAQFIG
jgi:hypothetical protein